MKKKTENRIHLLCAWSGMAFALPVLTGGVIFAGVLPPPSPDLSATQVAEIYRSNPNMIRIGMVLMMLAAGDVCRVEKGSNRRSGFKAEEFKTHQCTTVRPKCSFRRMA